MLKSKARGVLQYASQSDAFPSLSFKHVKFPNAAEKHGCSNHLTIHPLPPGRFTGQNRAFAVASIGAKKNPDLPDESFLNCPPIGLQLQVDGNLNIEEVLSAWAPAMLGMRSGPGGLGLTHCLFFSGTFLPCSMSGLCRVNRQ